MTPLTPADREEFRGLCEWFRDRRLAYLGDRLLANLEATEAERDRLRGDRSPEPGLTECECCGQAFGAIAAAVEAEREACASIAEEWAKECQLYGSPGVEVATEIGINIRARAGKETP
jgi:hypothetical protein